MHYLDYFQKEQTGYDLYHTFQEQLIYFGIQVIHKCIKNYQKWSRITWLRSNIFIKKEVQIKNIFFDERGEKALVEWIIHSKTKPQRIKDEFY